MGRFFKNDLHDEFGSWLLGYTATGGPDLGVLAGGRRGGRRRRRRRLPRRLDGDRRPLRSPRPTRSSPPAGATSAPPPDCSGPSACYATSYHPLYGAPVDPRLARRLPQADRDLRRGRWRSCPTR